VSAPDIHKLYEVTGRTWPARSSNHLGSIEVQYGAGGGKRVESARCARVITRGELRLAEDAMRGLSQTPLFMIQDGQDALDDMLAQEGYRLIDQVNLYVAPIQKLAIDPPPITGFAIWEPLAIMTDIWAQGGIGASRIDVMHRAQGPKTSVLGRINDHAAGCGFVAVADAVAMVHALEVLPEHRKHGLGRFMMQEAAIWAQSQGANWMSVICTVENHAANALYRGMGMSLVGHYHYRIKPDA